MSDARDEDLEYRRVNRNLGDPVYRIRILGLRLRARDAALCAGVGYGMMVLTGVLGIDEWWWYSRLIKVDPLAWLGATVVTAYLLTWLNRARPEGDVAEVIRSLGSVKLWSPGGCDREWTPGAGRRAE